MLDLVKISSMQLDLDKYINEHHKETDKGEHINKKLLALKQELGEVVQEMPGWFKFWSNKKNNLEAAQKEFADVLHFVVSIGNDIGYDFSYFKPSLIEYEHEYNLINWTYQLIPAESDAFTKRRYGSLLNYCLHIASVLELPHDEIEKMYREKWEINFKRQDEGY